MADIHPLSIAGNWRSGFALDIHTTSSTFLGVDSYGHNRYDNVRSEIGELLNRLKYSRDQTAVPEIIETAARYLAPRRTEFDLIVPVPPSTVRAVQPVALMAEGIGAALGLPVIACVKTTRATAQLKDVFDRDKRSELLAGLHAVDPEHTAGKNVLLFDDLFRSGATMNAIAQVLMTDGQAASVHAFTITRTRSHR